MSLPDNQYEKFKKLYNKCGKFDILTISTIETIKDDDTSFDIHNSQTFLPSTHKLIEVGNDLIIFINEQDESIRKIRRSEIEGYEFIHYLTQKERADFEDNLLLYNSN